ncbi:hypothetical protein AX15_001507 [Amanita polypyramis BW_CC]|nr:hypothetical protein AX15_001507 [Amanita polypyramis BW_CC]
MTATQVLHSRSISPSTIITHPVPRMGPTEFDILRASHKFLHDDQSSENTTSKSWNEKLAEKYYASLYREFAMCDLKHYKSGNFALRWRTEDEVLSGAGETTCANTRCEHHHPTLPSYLSPPVEKQSKVPLTTLELPFAYEEHGEQKSALVKVVLCDRCVRKLMWKRSKEKAKESSDGDREDDRRRRKRKSKEVEQPPLEDRIRGSREKDRDRGKRHRHQNDQRQDRKRSERSPQQHRLHHSRSRSPISHHANSASGTLR